MRWKCLAPILLFVLMMAGQAAAVPAPPTLHTLSQPDGTTFQARQWGDEFAHGWQTDEDLTILFDEPTGTWRYAVPGEDGALVASPAEVGKDQPPADAGTLRPAAALAEAAAKRALRSQRSASMPPSPSGTANILVVLMKFYDCPATYTRDALYNVFFGTNPIGSLPDYYREVSRNRFKVSDGGSTVGWFTARKPHNYYGQNLNALKTDIHVSELIVEAATALDTSGFDFSKFDSDGDCYVDAFSVVYAGTEESSSGVSTDIWPHEYKLSYTGKPFTTHTPCPGHPGQFIMVDDYIVQGERSDNGKGSAAITTIGTMAHEYGHVLGLVDLYDTDYSSNGIGDWSLMALGVYNGNPAGSQPAHLDPWSKSFLGWISPLMVEATLNNRQIMPIEKSGGLVYQLLEGNPLSGEYYLVENRQQIGFDAGLPASGLMIWHIDGDMVAKKLVSNTVDNSECYPGSTPSCQQQHYGVSLVQADGNYSLERVSWKNFRDSMSLGFPFPGSSGNRSFSDSTTPSAVLFTGASSGIQVASIATGSNGAMSATLSSPVGGITPPPTVCSSIASQGVSVPSGGGDTTVQVTASTGCDWSAASNASWITVSSGASGSGSGAVVVTVAANSGFRSRSGTVTIAGSTFTVSQQSPLPVVFTLTSAAMDPAQPIGSGKGSVKAVFSVSGSIAKADLLQLVSQVMQTADWVHVAPSGISIKSAKTPYSFTVTLTAIVDPNSSSQGRTGSLTLADQVYAVYQDGAPCAVSAIGLSPGKNFGSAGGSIGVTVTAPLACSWSVGIPAAAGWLSADTASGTATQSFNLTAVPNLGGPNKKGKYQKAGKRSATVTIQTAAARPAKKSFGVSQDGA